ncbi:MAG: cation:proton antiporter [archaeon]
MEVLALVFLCLTVSYIFSELAERVKLPRVLGSLFTGLVFGIPVVKYFIFTDASLTLMEAFAKMGLIFLMFYVGLELDFSDLTKRSGKAGMVALFNSVLPFALGFFTMRFLGYNNAVAIIVGACLSVTAEAVALDILKELNMMKTRIGRIIIEAGLFDDIVEILLVGGLITFIHSAKLSTGLTETIFIICFDLSMFFILVYLSKFIVIPLVLGFAERQRSRVSLYISSTILALFMASLSVYFGLGEVVGAVLAGMIIRFTLLRGSRAEKAEEKSIEEMIGLTTFGFFAPFFFIWVGMSSNFSVLLLDPVLAIAVTLAAFGGKMIGSIMAILWSKGTLLEGASIGWGMNSRGAVELVAAQLALTSGILSPNVFSALVFMAFVTTFFSPVFFKFFITLYNQKQKFSSRV